MKKIILSILVIALFSCSSNNDSSPAPTTFFPSHVGNWKTTFTTQNVDVVTVISNSNSSNYSKVTSANCYNFVPPTVGGNTQVLEDTTQKLSIYTSNIPASSIFSGADLNLLISNGYTTVAISDVFLHTSSTVISFGEVICAGNSTIELLTLSGNFVKISSFVNCAGKEINSQTGIKYQLPEKAKKILKKQKIRG